jgi:hypothetical protein
VAAADRKEESNNKHVYSVIINLCGLKPSRKRYERRKEKHFPREKLLKATVSRKMGTRYVRLIVVLK